MELKILLNMFNVLRTVALFSESICLFIPLINKRGRGFPNATIIRRSIIPITECVVKPNTIKEIPQRSSTSIKNLAFFLTFFDITGNILVKVIWVILNIERMKPNNNKETLI